MKHQRKRIGRLTFFRTILAAFIGLAALANGSESVASGLTGVIAGNYSSSTVTTLGTRASGSKPACVITSNADAKWVDYNPDEIHPNMASRKIEYVAMRDGIKLAVHITLPADEDGKELPGPFPTIVISTAYNGFIGTAGSSLVSEAAALGGPDPYMVKRGYATVVVDVRGTGQSEGTWGSFGPDEQADYGEMLDWIVKQTWCNGSIGLFGISYLGITTVLTESLNHPAVKAAFPVVPIGDPYRDTVCMGGQPNAVFLPLYLAMGTMPGLILAELFVSDPTYAFEILYQHVTESILEFALTTYIKGLTGDSEVVYDTDFWGSRAPIEKLQNCTVPTFVVGGLRDIFQRSEPITYETLKTNTTAKLIMVPGNHMEASEAEYTAYGLPPLNHILLHWFDQYVKGLDVGADKLPNVTQYVFGYDRFVTSTDWPHPQVSAKRFYLHGNNTLSEKAPASSEKSHTTKQTIADGWLSMSAVQWTSGALGLLDLPFYTYDYADPSDIVYESATLTEDLYINGPIEADMWISTTAQEAGICVRISDVQPDGKALALTAGLQLASLRAVDSTRSRFINGQSVQPWHPFTKASAQSVKGAVKVPVEIFETSALIAKGHKLRVTISTSNMPQGLPSLPTILKMLGGKVTVYSDASRPSSIVIPVVPADALKNGI